MDSMKSLDTSLPRSRSRTRPSHTHELLQTFRGAALAVTNLYKAAINDQTNNRHSGYQDALEDLLSFMNAQNLGLQDGEGWKIRQWATERFDGRDAMANSVDSEEDRTDTEKRATSSSPVPQPGTADETPNARDRDTSRPESAPPASRTDPDPSTETSRPPIFTFSATSQMMSRDVNMHTHETVPTDPLPANRSHSEHPTSQATGSSRAEARNRNARLQRGRNTRLSNRDLNVVSGTKRKLQFPDFFDLCGESSARDHLGSAGKRGKFS